MKRGIYTALPVAHAMAPVACGFHFFTAENPARVVFTARIKYGAWTSHLIKPELSQKEGRKVLERTREELEQEDLQALYLDYTRKVYRTRR